MTLQRFALLVTLVFALAVGAIALSVARSVLRLRRSSMAPERTEEAVLLRKRTHTRAHPGAPRRRTAHATVCYALFQTGDGKTSEYILPPEDFARLREGQRGRLTTQGERFRGFL